MPKKRITYWRVATGLRELIQEHREAINRLLNAEYAPGDLEKLRGHTIYSYRLSAAARLLFTTIDYQGQPCLHLLEHLPNHEYDKSRFLKLGVLKKYLEKHVVSHDESKQVFETVLPSTSLFQDEQPFDYDLEPVALDTFDYEWIELSPEQLAAVSLMEGSLESQSRINLPAVFTGPAGSGKTSTAFLLLEAYVKQLVTQAHFMADEEPKSLLYLTRSSLLSLKINQLWQDSPYAQGLPQSIQVNVLNYDDFLAGWLARPEFAPRKTLIGLYATDERAKEEERRSNFHAFFKDYKGKKDKSGDINALYQRIRMCSGYSTKEDYQLTSHRHVDELDREDVYTMYSAYLTFLQERQVCDPTVQALPKQPLYHFLIVDEGQDLGTRQLHNCLNVAENVILFMDGNQSLFDEQSKLPYLKHLFHQHQKNPRFYQLDGTYRCPKQIAAVANALLQAKYEITGGVADELESTTVKSRHQEHQNKGDVRFIPFEHLEREEHAWLFTQSQGTLFAVVTLPEFVKEAKQRFKTPLVFTSDQIKGLQYPCVVAYQLFSRDKFFGRACASLSPTPTIKEKVYMPKSGKGDFSLVPQFAGIYVGFTRPTERLIIIQDNGRDFSTLLSRLQQAIEHPLIDVTIDASIQSTPSDWLGESIRLHKEGASQQAQDIYDGFLTPEQKIRFHELTSSGQITRENPPEAASADESKFLVPSVVVSGSIKSTKKKTGKTVLALPAAPVVIKSPFELLLEAFTLENWTAFCQSPEGKKSIYTISSKTGMPMVIPIGKKTMPIEASLFYFILSDIQRTTVYVSALQSSPDAWDMLIKKGYLEAYETLFKKEKKHNPCEFMLLHCLFKAFCHHSIDDLLRNKFILDRIFLYTVGDFFNKSFVTDPLHWFIEPLLGNTHTLESEQITALYHFAKRPKGIDFLYKLLLSKKDVILRIPGEHWGWALPITAREEARCSPLFWLTAQKDGHPFLMRLLELNPNYIQKIPSTAWSLCLTSASAPHVFTSPFFWLAAQDKGQQVLISLFKKNPDYFCNIPINCWQHPYNSGTQATALYHLTGLPEGRQLLLSLLEYKPTYLLQLLPNAWSNPLLDPESIAYRNYSPIYWLTGDPKCGVKFLNLLFQNDPKYFLQIPASAWGLSLPATADDDENHSPLCWISSSPEGNKLLHKIVDTDPGYLLNIPASAWGLALTDKAKAHANHSPLYYLSSSVEGIKLLLKIHPAYLLKIPVSSWWLALTDKSGRCANVSPLYNLSSSPEGQLLLHRLFNLKADYILTIPPIAWSQSLTEAPHSSALFFLSKTRGGHQLLNKIFDRDPHYLLKIPRKAWNSTSASIEKSSFYWLLGSQEGRELIVNLFKYEPDRSKDMSVALWLAKVNLKSVPTKKIFLSYVVDRSKESSSIMPVLDKLKQHYPNLVSVIEKLLKESSLQHDFIRDLRQSTGFFQRNPRGVLGEPGLGSKRVTYDP